MKERLWLVSGFCRLSGPWRQEVRAASEEAAIAGYCLEHAMDPVMCRAVEVLELKDEGLKADRRAA
jgi:hypothetical protein